MKKILLIATGGTIASEKTQEGLAPSITSDELLKYVPDAAKYCTIFAVQVLNLDSTSIQPKHWIIMAKAVEEHYDDYDGFVITHGTDTMAYTAAALSYLIQGSMKPIVVTGSQKPISRDITDAKTNLLDSFIYASCDRAYGVNIVFGGKVIAGTRAKKERTKSYEAFFSINFPNLAVIQDEKVTFFIDDKPAHNHNKPVFYHKLNDKVLLLKLIPGMKAEILHKLCDDYDALIIESFGVGGIPEEDDELVLSFTDVLNDWAVKGKIVIMTTQVTNEGSDLSVYQVGQTVKNIANLMEAYDMTLESSVTKLMWMLANIEDQTQMRNAFYQIINRDILFSN